MTISLSYNSDLSRVQVEITGLVEDTVLVERSTNELYWRTVRGAEALAVASGTASVDDYEFTADVANFYRVTEAGSVVFTGSITPDLAGRVWLKSIRHPFLNRAVNVGWVDGDSSAAGGSVYEVQGRSVPVAVTDVSKSSAFTLTLRTATLEEARDLDLIIRSGDVFFVHVPAGSQIPGGHVRIDDRAMRRLGPVSTRRRWPLPCRVVAAPGPGVVGGTMTYGALLNLYGGYDNVLAANPTYADLLDLMASPEDLVVL
ncbi:hypothetical protein GCM10027447_12370 [Glycomyces halotolerans]